jgi:hypothetical protein
MFLPGQTLVVPPRATTPPDRTVPPGETPPPSRAPTGSTSDAGSLICSSPGPIIPAWVGAMIVIAAAIPMAAPKIGVLTYMFMIRALSVS